MTPTSILFGYGVLGASLVLPSIASSFVMADVMGMTPSEMAAVAVWCSLPWVTKPLWGAVSDRCAVCGYRRRPYVCVFSLVATASFATTPYYATAKTRDMMIFLLFCTSAALCVMDVALDGSLMVLVKKEKKGTENEGKSFEKAREKAMFLCFSYGRYVFASGLSLAGRQPAVRK